MIKEISAIFPLFESVDSRHMPKKLFDYSFRYIVSDFWDNCNNEGFMENPDSWGNMMEMTDEETKTDYLNIYGICRYNMNIECKSGTPKRRDFSVLSRLIEDQFLSLYAEYYYIEDSENTNKKFDDLLERINNYSFDITIGKNASSRTYHINAFIVEEFFQTTYEKFCNEFLNDITVADQHKNGNITIH